jgi:crotonobetainyl-CoA:carnitine CoA-transferase CaiB-like acyl-CoA transferase
MSGPLSGIHGLDLTSAVLGPVATQIVAATGFRKDGAYPDRQSYDDIIQRESGLAVRKAATAPAQGRWDIAGCEAAVIPPAPRLGAGRQNRCSQTVP